MTIHLFTLPVGVVRAIAGKGKSSLTCWKKSQITREYKLIQEKLIKKVTKGARRMPWLSQAMKDVTSCDKLREGANSH